MADNFGLKIGIEGEKEFKKALSEINQSFKVLGSEMKLVSSQFDANDKSIQALSKIPLVVPCLKGSGTDIIDNGITENVVLYFLLRHIFCFFSNDYCQFYLIV